MAHLARLASGPPYFAGLLNGEPCGHIPPRLAASLFSTAHIYRAMEKGNGMDSVQAMQLVHTHAHRIRKGLDLTPEESRVQLQPLAPHHLGAYIPGKHIVLDPHQHEDALGIVGSVAHEMRHAWQQRHGIDSRLERILYNRRWRIFPLAYHAIPDEFDAYDFEFLYLKQQYPNVLREPPKAKLWPLFDTLTQAGNERDPKLVAEYNSLHYGNTEFTYWLHEYVRETGFNPY